MHINALITSCTTFPCQEQHLLVNYYFFIFVFTNTLQYHFVLQCHNFLMAIRFSYPTISVCLILLHRQFQYMLPSPVSFNIPCLYTFHVFMFSHLINRLKIEFNCQIKQSISNETLNDLKKWKASPEAVDKIIHRIRIR